MTISWSFEPMSTRSARLDFIDNNGGGLTNIWLYDFATHGDSGSLSSPGDFSSIDLSALTCDGGYLILTMASDNNSDSVTVTITAMNH